MSEETKILSIKDYLANKKDVDYIEKFGVNYEKYKKLKKETFNFTDEEVEHLVNQSKKPNE